MLEALAGYRAGTGEEAADLDRIRALVAAGDPWDRSTPLHITVSALVVHPPTRRVLLRWHARQQAWLHVGGHADPGETEPLAIAVREAREETGLEDLLPWPDPAVLHVAVVPVRAAAHEPAHEHADLRFVLATGQPDRARPENPAAPVRWLSIPDAKVTTGSDDLRKALTRLERLFSSLSNQSG
jgi:8-oxo-dGTP pyrophosphatase MutT (NUDIX family)